jgi:hypothetical protein
MRAVALVVLISILASGCAGPFMLRKTHWTVQEVQEWYPEYRKDPRAWDGILYQGSSAKWHYYVARLISMDNWVAIQIRRTDLVVADERPYPRPSGAGLGYYFVDPNNDFVKLRDAQ